MRKLLFFGAIALGNGIEASFGDQENVEPRTPVEYDIQSNKPLSMTCDSTEICDADADLKHWAKVADADRYNGEWVVQDHPWIRGKRQLVMQEEMKYYGLSRAVPTWTPTDGKPLSFSMTARFAEDHNCGGAYVKFYKMDSEGSHDLDGHKPYSIMFGPDRCGVATRKVHFIVQYTDASGRRVEEHLSTVIDLPADMRKTHQYGFSLFPNGKAEILVDGQVVQEGQLKQLTTPGWKSPETIDDPTDPAPADWTPPPRMIPDPDAVKPEDWDDDEPENIEDPDATMPEDWYEDEPELVPKMDAQKPEDWDETEDGEWVRPLMKNPKCTEGSGCGPWTRPMIPNPRYRGSWTPPMIPNPAYTDKYPTRQIPHPAPYDIKDPFAQIEPFDAFGVEVWTVQAGTVLDNFMLSTKPDRMRDWSRQAFEQIFSVEAENYKRALDNGVESVATKPAADPHRYVKIGGVALMGFVVVTVAVRRLLGFNFRSSDMPKRDDAAVPATSGEVEETKENKTDEGKLMEETDTAVAATDEDKKADERETEPSAGETKPTKRA